MSRPLRVALIQQHGSHDIQDNIQRGVQAFERAAREGANLIAFAELAFTPFYPQRPAGENVLDLAESIPGPTTNRFAELAVTYQVVTVLNLFERDGGKTYDASPVIDADGSILGVTRMVHIIEAPLFHEQGYYYPGDGRSMVYDTAAGRIGIAICYDRHFPEYMRILGILGAELVIVPQAGSVGEWPQGLYEAELQIAGFQNGYFTALCNRVGREEKISFEGKSFITAPDGQVIAQAAALEDAILFADIDLDLVNNSHARRHFFQDRRPDVYGRLLSEMKSLTK
jgi:N-carbamoylputrescine amidase